MSSSDKQPTQTRKAHGRRKVNMARIENEINRQVAFSKRRHGLFKKASELCTLTGAQVAIVVFSPGSKVHSFGHPDVNTIAHKFLGQNRPPNFNAQRSSMLAQKKADLEYLTQLEKQLEAGKKRGEKMKQMGKDCKRDLEELKCEQLEDLKGKLVDFGKNLKTKVENAVKPRPMMQYDVVPHGTFVVPFVPSDDAMVRYDHGATAPSDAGTSYQFGTGNSCGRF